VKTVKPFNGVNRKVDKILLDFSSERLYTNSQIGKRGEFKYNREQEFFHPRLIRINQGTAVGQKLLLCFFLIGKLISIVVVTWRMPAN